jgi:hypothetical protein
MNLFKLREDNDIVLIVDLIPEFGCSRKLMLCIRKDAYFEPVVCDN